jgi:hypothetical protein
MKTIKVIDLLIKIANGEEVPKKIKYYDLIYEFCSRCKQYEHFDKDKTLQIKLFEEIVDLNDEIEIIEDTSKEDKKIEYLDLEDLNKLIKNDYNEYMLRYTIHKILIEIKGKIN